jgi:hypothetical protein
MLDSGKKIALCATKKLNILTLVLSEIKFLNDIGNQNIFLEQKACKVELSGIIPVLYDVFPKKKILIPNLAEKNILILVEKK